MKNRRFLKGEPLPAWAKDAVYTDAVVTLDFLDRVRVLFGRPVMLRLRTATECHLAIQPEGATTFRPAKIETESVTWVEPIFKLPPRPSEGFGVAVTVETEEDRAFL